jgi:hypothetical protein
MKDQAMVRPRPVAPQCVFDGRAARLADVQDVHNPSSTHAAVPFVDRIDQCRPVPLLPAHGLRRYQGGSVL